jgi:hypothetical protein
MTDEFEKVAELFPEVPLKNLKTTFEVGRWGVAFG